MKDTESFRELAKTQASQDPLVRVCILEIIAADSGDYQTTAQSLEKLRKYLEKFASAPSIDEVGIFAVVAAIEAGEPRKRWVKLQARIHVYQRLLAEDGTGGKNSGGDPDPMPAPVRQRRRGDAQR